MNTTKLKPPAPDGALSLIRGELSTPRRWWYRVLLAGISVWVAALVSLWATEPRPLPLRLHVAFAALTVIGIGWVAVLGWILTRRSCPTAADRLATALMAAVACGMFLAIAVPIALVREGMLQALTLGVVGLFLLGVALILLRRAFLLRAALRAKLAELEKAN